MKALEISIRKNKIDLEYQAIIQERNATLLALVGVPATIFNIAITLLKWDVLAAAVVAFFSVWVLWGVKLALDNKIKDKIGELDRISAR